MQASSFPPLPVGNKCLILNYEKSIPNWVPTYLPVETVSEEDRLRMKQDLLNLGEYPFAFWRGEKNLYPYFKRRAIHDIYGFSSTLQRLGTYRFLPTEGYRYRVPVPFKFLKNAEKC